MSVARTIASATSKLALSQASVRLLSLLTMPLLTRLLAPDAYGAAAMLGTVISLVAVLALAGMEMSYVRTCNGVSAEIAQPREAFAWRFALVSATIGGAIAGALWVLFATRLTLPAYLGIFLLLGVFLSVASAMAQARARLQLRYGDLSRALVISGIAATVASIAAAVWWRQDEFPLVLSMVTAYLIPLLVLGLPPWPSMSRPSGLDAAERGTMFRIGVAGLVTAPAYWLLSSSDRWFISYYEGAASVGIYSVGYSVAIMGMMANTAVLAVWTPETVREYEAGHRQAQENLGRVAEAVCGGFACVFVAVAAAGGDAIRLLAAPSFHAAANIVPFVAGSVLFNGLYHLANATFLLMRRLPYVIRWWVFGCGISIAANLLLVPRFGRTGAALTQFIAFGLIAAGTVWGAQRLYPLTIRAKRVATVLSISIALGFVMSPPWHASPVISLMIKFPFGAFAAATILQLLAPQSLRWAAQVVIDKCWK